MTTSSILGNSSLATGLNIFQSSLLPTMFKTSNTRSFKSKNISIIAPCNIQEKHSDRFQVTEHPTEMGVLISDHMYALPQRVEIQVGYSLSSGINALKQLGSFLGVSSSPKSLKDYYNAFLKLQSDRIPFDITTGKRQYKNMVIEDIEETTDKMSENSLFLTLRCREVIIVNTETYTSNDLQADAPNTAPPTNTGTQSTSGPNTYSLPPNTAITGAPL